MDKDGSEHSSVPLRAAFPSCFGSPSSFFASLRNHNESAVL